LIVEDKELLEKILEQAIRFALETAPIQKVPEIVKREVFEQLRRNNLVVGKRISSPPDSDD
jgi:hypothetical protein